MSKHIAKRLIGVIPVLLGVSLVIFIVLMVLPGDPARLMAGEFADPATVKIIRHEMGLDRPLLEQYLRMLLQFARGDFGKSYMSRRPVLQEIAETFPKTVMLSVAVVMCGGVLGCALGLCAALSRYFAGPAFRIGAQASSVVT
ncbi:MAG: hypothetical protein ACM3ZU_04585 [Bacteroidota bacterium]